MNTQVNSPGCLLKTGMRRGEPDWKPARSPLDPALAHRFASFYLYSPADSPSEPMRWAVCTQTTVNHVNLDKMDSWRRPGWDEPLRVLQGHSWHFWLSGLCYFFLQAGGELSWGGENQRSWGKQITALVDRCRCLFLPTGHGYNSVCFDSRQHSPHRLCRGRASLKKGKKKKKCVVYFDIATAWATVGTRCEEKHQGWAVTFTSGMYCMTLKLHFLWLHETGELSHDSSWGGKTRTCWPLLETQGSVGSVERGWEVIPCFPPSGKKHVICISFICSLDSGSAAPRIQKCFIKVSRPWHVKSASHSFSVGQRLLVRQMGLLLGSAPRKGISRRSPWFSHCVRFPFSHHPQQLILSFSYRPFLLQQQ